MGDRLWSDCIFGKRNFAVIFLVLKIFLLLFVFIFLNYLANYIVNCKILKKMLAKDMATSFFDFLHVNKQKTFRPKKRFPHGTLRYNLHKQAQATLNSGVDLKQVVKLPATEVLEDWLAVNTVDFFNRINLLYGILADSCTPDACPTMSGGPRYEYLWQDGAQYKKPTRLPAKDYMHLLMDWIEERINDEKIFPTATDVPFPTDFRQTCKKILSRLFRIFVHVYIHHFDRLVQIGAEPHANMLYKHFYYFVTEHNMVSQRELDALKDLTARLITSQHNQQHTAVDAKNGSTAKQISPAKTN